MNSNLEGELKVIIESDKWMMDVLKTVRDLRLKDCWVGAGFVRNKIWDVKHGKERTELSDIDVIHFDTTKWTKEYDSKIEQKLKIGNPDLNWSVKNQLRMNIRNGNQPYANCNEAIFFWPETATSIAIRLNFKNQIEYIAPYGLGDLFNLKVIPTPNVDLAIYHDRIKKKEWIKKWNKLKIKICGCNQVKTT